MLKDLPCFYQPNAELSELVDEEFIHATRVMRLKAGDEIYISDGAGRIWESEIVGIKKATLEFERKALTEFPRPQPIINVYIPVLKNNDRLEWLVEKGQEIGLNQIAFYNTAKSITRNVNLERMERICISALKQSKSPYKSNLTVSTFSAVLKENSSPNRNAVITFHDGHLHPVTDINLILEEKKNLAELKQITILIGPEADFTESELVELRNAGAELSSLPFNRLRSETAALVACTICKNYFS